MTGKLRFVSLATAILSIISFSLAGCRTTPAGYKTYSLPDKGIAHMSFDYPACFNIRQVQLLDESGIERIDIDGPYSTQNRVRTTMWVVAQRYPETTKVADLLDSALATARGLSGYQLLDRSSTIAAGIPAEQIVYFYFSPRSDYETRILGLKPTPTVTRQVYFAYGNLLWVVAMSSDQSTADSDLPDFKHLLQTLQMLP